MLRRTPKAVRDLVSPGERVLAWGTIRSATGGYAVATDQALYLPEMIRLPWEQITKATWGDDFVLVVEGRLVAPGEARRDGHAAPVGPDRSWRVAIDDPHALPTVVYERVTSTIVVSERVVLQGDRGARVVGRRAGDGVRWTVTFDPGLDAEDPELRRRANEALADLRATLGV